MIIFVLVTYWAIRHFSLLNNVNIMATVYTAYCAIIWFSKQENWAFSWSLLRAKVTSDFFFNRAVVCSNQHFINCECLIWYKISQAEIKYVSNTRLYFIEWHLRTVNYEIKTKHSVLREKTCVSFTAFYETVGMPISLNLYVNPKLNFHSNL